MVQSWISWKQSINFSWKFHFHNAVFHHALMQMDEDRCWIIMYPHAPFAVHAASKLTTFLLFFSRETERAIFRSGSWPDSAWDCICTWSAHLPPAAGQHSEVKWQRSANIGAATWPSWRTCMSFEFAGPWHCSFKRATIPLKPLYGRSVFYQILLPQKCQWEQTEHTHLEFTRSKMIATSDHCNYINHNTRRQSQIALFVVYDIMHLMANTLKANEILTVRGPFNEATRAVITKDDIIDNIMHAFSVLLDGDIDQRSRFLLNKIQPEFTETEPNDPETLRNYFLQLGQ